MYFNGYKEESRGVKC